MSRFFFVLFFLSQIVISQSINKTLIPYREGKLWGFCDTLGKVLVKPYLDTIHDVKYDYFFKRAAFLVEKNKKKFVVNQYNQQVLPITHSYDSIALRQIDVQYIDVYKKKKMGLFKNLKELVPCSYDYVAAIANSSYKVYNQNKCGIVNAKKVLVVPVLYDDVYPSSNESKEKFVWEAVLNDKKKYFYDTKVLIMDDDEVVGMKEMRRGTYFTDSELEVIRVKLLDKYTFVSLDEAAGIAYVGDSKDKIGVYDLYKEKIIVTPEFEKISFIDDNGKNKVFKIKLHNNWGLIKEGNEMFLPILYDNIEYNRSMGIFLIYLNKKIGIKFSNTIYPTIEPKYLKIITKQSMIVNEHWNFSVIQVQTANGYGFIGENSIEYFKD